MAASKQVKDLVQLAASAANEKLATDIVALDMSDQLILSEAFLIVTGANENQVDAIADFVFEKLAEAGEKPIRKEGKGQWVLLDYSDLVVHVQIKELRDYYLLDRLWNDCPRIEVELEEAR